MSRTGFDQQVTFLSVASLDAAAGFYQGVLGLELVLDQGACRIYRTTGDAFLGFCRPTAHLRDERAGGVILTLVVADPAAVDGWHARLVQSGHGEWVVRPPTLNTTFNIYHLFLRDPDGYLVEIQSFLDPAWPLPARAPVEGASRS